jgi:hypothetical protein
VSLTARRTGPARAAPSPTSTIFTTEAIVAELFLAIEAAF